jgi:alpha-beta hydrolase superfamily lysophospholipase
MIRRSFACAIVTFLLALSASAQEAVSFKASDGVMVFGDVYEVADAKRPVIVCFHMAGSDRGEYAKIAPRLVKLGFNVLAIDQHSGSGKTARVYGKKANYLDALPDLHAAVAFERALHPDSKLIVWGSSYSASLVFLLAAKDRDIAGVLAFSPGEYLGEDGTVKQAAQGVTAPIFVTSARNEATDVKAILDAAVSKLKVQFVPQGPGEHGSSALLLELAAGAEYWKAVESFLAQLN